MISPMGSYLIAGGTRGIGLELVRELAPSASRIDVWSRSAGELPIGGPSGTSPATSSAPTRCPIRPSPSRVPSTARVRLI